MTTRNKIIGAAVILLATFAAGRFSVQAPTVHTIVDTDQTKAIDVDKDTHKDTTITTEKAPDGTTKVITHIVEDTDIKKAIQTDTQTHIDTTITPPSTNTLNISGIVGIDYNNGAMPTYGLSVTKQVLGPVTIGVLGLTNHTVAATIGLNF